MTIQAYLPGTNNRSSLLSGFRKRLIHCT